MDKVSDDRMAPALHTTEHSQHNSKFHHFCLPPDTDRDENHSKCEEVNGVCESETSQSLAMSAGEDKSKNAVHGHKIHLSMPPNDSDILSRGLQSNGESGDYVTSLDQLQKDIKHSYKGKAFFEANTGNNGGGGGGFHTETKTNGWSPKHETGTDQNSKGVIHDNSNTGQSKSPVQTLSNGNRVNNKTCFESLESSGSDNFGASPNANGLLDYDNNCGVTHVNNDQQLDKTSAHASSSTSNSIFQQEPSFANHSNSGTIPSTVSAADVALDTETTTASIFPCNTEVRLTEDVNAVAQDVLCSILDSVVGIEKKSTYLTVDADNDCSPNKLIETTKTHLSSSNLNLPNASGLAHGLISSPHMQNLPQNLANTLLELAASLTSGQNINEDKDKNPLAFLNGHRHTTTTKSLNLEPPKVCKVIRIANSDEIKSRQKLQLSKVQDVHFKLIEQLSALTKRVNKIRSEALSAEISSQLKVLSECSKPDSNLDSTTTKQNNSSTTFWRAKLSKKVFRHRRKHFIADVEHGLVTVSHSNSFDELPNQLDQEKQLKVHRQAKTNLGILKKEVKFIQTNIDPNLTDDSSDEDPTDLIYKSGQGLVPKKLKSKTPQTPECNEITKARIVEAQENFLMHRLSVAKRWTWLQAQVSDLEFKIRTHNEIYRQLRSNKPEIVLGQQRVIPTPTDDTEATEDSKITSAPGSARTVSALDQSSPFNVNKMMQNVNKQTTSLLDNLTPLSAGPSPSLPNQQAPDTKEKEMRQPRSDPTCVAARTRPLLNPHHRRQIVNARKLCNTNPKTLRPPSVVDNEASLMSDQFSRSTPFHRSDGKMLDVVKDMSVQFRAAKHDHSYHKVLSTEEDVPLSLRVNSFMKSSQKWFNDKLTKRERRMEKKKRKNKNKSDSSEKVKHRPRSATLSLKSISSRVHPSESNQNEMSKRRGSFQSIHELHNNNKRQRINSIDSDIDSLYVRSGASTPTTDGYSNLQMQTVLKRKRQSDQAYDINNIVIPSGLTTTRIEKLQYKEILTPGWRALPEEEPKPTESTKHETTDKKDCKTEPPTASDVTEPLGAEEEKLCDDEYRLRHDRYEIAEKRKYVAYMEWSRNKKNGTRYISRANMPSSIEAAVRSSSAMFNENLRSSPVSSHVTSPDATSPARSPDSQFALPGIRTRRTSSDQTRFSSHDSNPTIPREALSSADEGTPSRAYSDWYSSGWETRVFPLNDTAYEDLMKKPVVPDIPAAPRLRTSESFETGENRFRPISRHPSVDTNTALKHRTPKPGEPASRKRHRTSSQLSSLSRDDERHSDCSVSSTQSSKRYHSQQYFSESFPPVGGRPHKRHKSSLRDDFIFYTDLGSETETASDFENEGDVSLLSDHDDQWTTRPLTTSYKDKSRQNSIESQHKEPLVLTIKRSK